jgi:hypothetical protein
MRARGALAESEDIIAFEEIKSEPKVGLLLGRFVSIG